MKKEIRAFTIIEALFVLVICSVGFSAIFALQFVEVEQAQFGKDLAFAVNLADRTIADLQKQSMTWTGIRLPKPLDQSDGVWHSYTLFPINQNMQMSIENDAQFGSNLKKQRYCIHLWMSPMNGVYEGLLNARIRVLWSKDIHYTPTDFCLEGNANRFDPTPALNPQINSITIPFAIRRHPL